MADRFARRDSARVGCVFDWRQEWEAEFAVPANLLLAEWDRLDWTNRLNLLKRSTIRFFFGMLFWLQQLRLEDEMIQDFTLRTKECC